MAFLYRLVDWDRVHENHESRKLKRLQWIGMPTNHDTFGYRTLMSKPNGTALYGAFHQILALAAKCKPRGTLVRASGQPHTAASIALSVSGDAALIQQCLDILQDSEIGWIEAVELPAVAGGIPARSGEFPGTSGESPDTSGSTRARVPSLLSLPVVCSSLKSTSETSPPASASFIFPRTWEQDEQYARFVTDYLNTGANLIGEDFAEAWQWSWKPLDFEQKLERIAALNRHAEEYHADPRYVPKPKKFLETEWKRDPKPPARSAAPVRKKSNRELLIERMEKTS